MLEPDRYWPSCSGMGGNNGLEQVATMALEWVATIVRNPRNTHEYAVSANFQIKRGKFQGTWKDLIVEGNLRETPCVGMAPFRLAPRARVACGARLA